MGRTFEGRFVGAGRSFAIVVGRFNALFGEQLLAGCVDGLRRHGVDEDSIDVVWVPGAWEIPLACRRVARTGRYAAVIALGAVIRGGTPHFDYVAGECAKGIGNVAFLPPVSDTETAPLAFDTGPANVLIDIVMGLLTDGREACDVDGATAAAGRVDDGWLAELLALPYYAQSPPKTTGRELFSPDMGRTLLEQGRRRNLADTDIVATLTALSGASVADQYRRFLPVVPDEVIVAAYNAKMTGSA